MGTVRLTTSEAIVRYLIAQRIEDDRTGEIVPLVPGVFAIFGHGNALGLGEALERHQGEIRTIRGQNEQGMALAAVAYAKAARRRQVMAVTTSIGPGALNTVTAAGVAMANRLPLLLLLGDTFQSRLPDPVLQQIEQFGAPSVTANDALRPLSRYWDRIVRPEQVLSSLPQAIGVLLDPADCGPVTLALPQDVQGQAYDFPESFFEPIVHRIRRPRPDPEEIAAAVEVLMSAQQPLIVAGGGVHYSLAERELTEFAHRFGIPVMETVAGKSSLTHDDPNLAGPIGVFGEQAGQSVAWEPDAVLAVGTRLQDFTTESATVFKNPDVQVISLNVGRFDALKRGALPVIGDARAALADLAEGLSDWTAPEAWLARARESMERQRATLDARQAETDTDRPTYAQVIGVVNEVATPEDYVVVSSGGLAGEIVMNWRSRAVATFDCEYGFSCMGYELSGTWGAAMERGTTHPGSTVYGLLGDGSFMMLPMDIYSGVLTGTSMTLLVCDNGGFNVIERLQLNNGAASFKTMLADDDHPTPPAIDFAAIATAMGAGGRRATGLAELETVLRETHGQPGVHVIAIDVAVHQWSEGGSFWQTGVPEVSDRETVDEARERLLEGLSHQRSLWRR
ncbi:MAG: 3D-(3,5/4)-trihydroxycyclohexane-1,2-dione acylhydrolase (decyclizing) [Actinomycetales bacterium]|nr:3D-(3,5/4)-trihydroxycyclohexane-1,2-dione acylhydrolase (decyclizing) [Actinomycetales bacterium]